MTKYSGGGSPLFPTGMMLSTRIVVNVIVAANATHLI